MSAPARGLACGRNRDLDSGHAVLAWEAARDSAQRVVFAQLIPVPGVLGVPPPVPRGLALAGFAPNPARTVIQVASRLPSTDDATLEVFDIFGRQGGRGEAAGLYLVHVRPGGQERTTRGMFAR